MIGHRLGHLSGSHNHFQGLIFSMSKFCVLFLSVKIGFSFYLGYFHQLQHSNEQFLYLQDYYLNKQMAKLCLF